MTRLLFFDIDGTLVRWDSMELPPTGVLEDFGHLREMGHRLFLCTGRPLGDIGPLRELPFDGIISGAGARIQVGDQVIFHRVMPKKLLEQVVELLIDRELTGLLEGTNGFYYAGQGKRTLNWDFPRLHSPEELTGQESVELFTIRFDYQKQITDILPFLQSHFEIYRCEDPLRLEMGLPGQNKAQAIKRVCAHLKAPLQDTVAFGDSENDLAMLRTAGVGVAMGNAPLPVRQAADMVTGTWEQDGVSQAFRQLGLLK